MPKYSPGYPFLMAVAYWFGGDEAMFLVSPIAGTLTLIGCFLLFQLWMPPFMAALSVWVLAINPMWLAYPGYLLTHGVKLHGACTSCGSGLTVEQTDSVSWQA